MDFITKCFKRNQTEEQHESSGTSSFQILSSNSSESVAVMSPNQGFENSKKAKELELISTLKKKELDAEKIMNFITVEEVDINSCDKLQHSVLHLAVAKVDNKNARHFELIRFLIENGADLKAKTKGGETPFLFAVKKNKFTLINLFVENVNNDINAKNRDGDTALHIAVKNNHINCVVMLRLLAKTRGLKKNETNNVQQTPVSIAGANDSKVIPEIARILKLPDDEFSEEFPQDLSVLAAGGTDNVAYSFGSGGMVNIHISGDATAFVGSNKIYTDYAENDLKEVIPAKCSEDNVKATEASPHAEPPRGRNPYEMKANPRGICLIIKNEHFTEAAKKKGIEDRFGCQTDVDNLKKTFEWLLFKVEVIDDLTSDDMLTKLKEYANKDHSKYDCFVACILSHGCTGAIYGVDGQVVEINCILQLFSGKGNGKSLRDKPKLFFLNACRLKETSVTSDGLGSEKAMDDAKPWFAPDRSDMLIGYSCPDGFESWRYKNADSWYITELCRVLRECAKDEELQHIMLEVNDAVSTYLVNTYGSEINQIPAPVSCLRKKLWFFPEQR